MKVYEIDTKHFDVEITKGKTIVKVVTLQDVREIGRMIIWEIAQKEGGHILHYNEWLDDNLINIINSKNSAKTNSQKNQSAILDEINFAIEGCKDEKLKGWYKNYLIPKYSLRGDE